MFCMNLNFPILLSYNYNYAAPVLANEHFITLYRKSLNSETSKKILYM